MGKLYLKEIAALSMSTLFLVSIFTVSVSFGSELSDGVKREVKNLVDHAYLECKKDKLNFEDMLRCMFVHEDSDWNEQLKRAAINGKIDHRASFKEEGDRWALKERNEYWRELAKGKVYQSYSEETSDKDIEKRDRLYKFHERLHPETDLELGCDYGFVPFMHCAIYFGPR